MAAAENDDEVVLTSLEEIHLASLRDEWSRRWGTSPTMRSVRILRQLTAWRNQAARHGGLTADDRRRGSPSPAGLGMFSTLRVAAETDAAAFYTGE